MRGEGDAVGGEGEEAVGLGFLKDGRERAESGGGEGAGEVGEREAFVGAEAEEEGLFEDGFRGEALDGGDGGGGGGGAVGEDGQD